MAELEHVVKTFSLLEAAEKEQPFLTREQKQDLYRIAFHKESMEEVEKNYFAVTGASCRKGRKRAYSLSLP